MLAWLRQATATTVKIGPFLDSTDGNTVEGGLTISQADVRLSKNGGDFAQKGDATACSHDELGYYDCPLNATDTGTLGRLRLAVHEGGALAVWHDFMVVPANVWDSLFGTDKLQVHADEITADLINANAIAPNAIDASALSADAGAEIRSGLATTADVAVVDVIVNTILALLEGRLTTARAGYLDNLSGGVVPTAGGIADAVWDEALSGHATAGSAGKALGDVGDPWAKALPGSYPAGSAGHILGNPLNVNAAQLGGSITAMENLRDGALALIRGAAVAGTLSTTQMTTNVTGLPADAVVGRLVSFGPPGALRYQQRRIVDYVAANGLITLDAAVTSAVVAGQTFVIQ